MSRHKTSGWEMARKGVIPTRFQVFGERSSGTNFVKRLIGRNSDLRACEDLGWKHGFPQMTAIPEDFLIVCVTRNALDWARSMHAKPWHCPDDMQALEFSDFIRAPWATIADRDRYFPQVAQLGGRGRPLQHDRHPLTGETFANLFALRNAKATALLSYKARSCSIIFTQMEAVTRAPERFLFDLHTQFELPPKDQNYRPILKRLGSKFKPSIEQRPSTPDTWAENDIAFLKGQLDPEQEARLGYHYT